MHPLFALLGITDPTETNVKPATTRFAEFAASVQNALVELSESPPWKDAIALAAGLQESVRKLSELLPKLMSIDSEKCREWLALLEDNLHPKAPLYLPSPSSLSEAYVAEDVAAPVEPRTIDEGSKPKRRIGFRAPGDEDDRGSRPRVLRAGSR